MSTLQVDKQDNFLSLLENIFLRRKIVILHYIIKQHEVWLDLWPRENWGCVQLVCFTHVRTTKPWGAFSE
jgi:hypothetical protein